MIELSSAGGDEAAVARAWRRLSSARRRVGAYLDAEAAARSALSHARAAGDRREEARAADALCNCLLYGPTPASDALATCSELLTAAGRTRTLEANVTGVVAGLEAMLGDFDKARAAYARAASMLEELGLELARAALTQIGVPLELLAGDPIAGEREARKGAEIFERFGSSVVQAPLIAESLHAQGRFHEAAQALTEAAVESRPAIAQWQVHWRIVEARLALADERPVDAVESAGAGVALAELTEDLNLRGDAMAALGAAQRAVGRHKEAAEALRSARVFYEAKGNVAAVAVLPVEAQSTA